MGNVQPPKIAQPTRPVRRAEVKKRTSSQLIVLGINLMLFACCIGALIYYMQRHSKDNEAILEEHRKWQIEQKAAEEKLRELQSQKVDKVQSVAEPKATLPATIHSPATPFTGTSLPEELQPPIPGKAERARLRVPQYVPKYESQTEQEAPPERPIPRLLTEVQMEKPATDAKRATDEPDAATQAKLKAEIAALAEKGKADSREKNNARMLALWEKRLENAQKQLQDLGERPSPQTRTITSASGVSITEDNLGEVTAYDIKRQRIESEIAQCKRGIESLRK
ncbi:MAG TPA: hypothetical protein VKX17_16225 [Planctomycetota bacterium]|nr:hypothetical protein [Planctomycetota bacterium]